jgi:hypothetical protein
MSSADVVYYNLTIGNNDPTTAGLPVNNDVPAQITALNNIPIIGNPNDYYCSIIRFQIPALTLPILNVVIRQTIDGSGNPIISNIDETIYSFTVNNGTQTFVQWIPQVILPSFEIPVVGTPTQALSEYYLCYSYKWFISLWNTAIATACASAGVADVPFFYYDAVSQLISLYSFPSFDTDNGGTNTLFYNAPFIPYFVGLESIYLNQSPINDPNGKDNSIVVRDLIINAETINSINYLVMSYEYNAFGYWNFLKQIIITTTMNVVSEALFNNNSSTFQNVQYVNIIEDYYPDLALQNGAGVSSQIFTYNAPSLYRIFTFNQTNPLYRVDLGISVVNTYGNIFPLQLPKGQLANFKLMFIKKSVYASINKNLN